MIINEIQAATLNIQLSALGQTDLSDNDPDLLQLLEFVLEQALKNVQRALNKQNPA